MKKERGPDLISFSALMSSALRAWSNNEPTEMGHFEDPSAAAWAEVRPKNSKLDPNEEGIQDGYAFQAGFDMAVALCLKLLRKPFGDVTDIIERASEECEQYLKDSVENRAGRRRTERGCHR